MKKFFALLCMCQAFYFATSSAPETGHYLHRRQTLPTERLGGPRCFDEYLEAQCTSGFKQGEIDIQQGCGRENLARLSVAECAQNEDGQYCTNALLGLLDVVTLNSISGDFCSGVMANGSCTNTCRDNLEAMRVYGCCLNTVFNTTSAHALFGTADLLSNQLWGLCNVEPLDFCELNPAVTIPQAASENCNTDEFVTQLLNYRCNNDNTGPILDRLFNQNCEDLAEFTINQCAIGNGQLCALSAGEVTTRSVSISSDCVSATDTCPDSCGSALRSYRDTAGCCLNSLLNNTFQSNVPNPSTNIELWDRCNVDSPGFCPSTLGGNTVHQGVFMLTVVFAMLSAVLIGI